MKYISYGKVLVKMYVKNWMAMHEEKKTVQNNNKSICTIII